jgi:hypothetical protein
MTASLLEGGSTQYARKGKRGTSMKRISLFTMLAVVATGVFSSVSSAAPGAAAGLRHSAALKVAAERTPFTAEYNASEYYGEVKCTGTHIVSNKYPNGADKETCEAVTELAHMTAGGGQKEFENTGGGKVATWASDYNSVETTNFTYKVSKNLKRFHIVAIY